MTPEQRYRQSVVKWRIIARRERAAFDRGEIGGFGDFDRRRQIDLARTAYEAGRAAAEKRIAALAPYAMVGFAALDHYRQGWDLDGMTLHEELLAAGVIAEDADGLGVAEGEGAARAALITHFYGEGLTVARRGAGGTDP